MKNAIRPKLGIVGAFCTALLLSASATDVDSPLADAAMNGDLELVRELLVQGADVNASQGDGMTALHWAAEDGNVEMLRILLFAGAFPDAMTRNGGYTPLHLAARAGRSAAVASLLEGGADAGARSTTGTTPLHFAAAAGTVESIASLLAHGAQVDAVEAASEQTPLIFAASAGRVAAINALLEAGADVAHVTKVIDVVARAAEDRELRALRDQRKMLEWESGFAESGYGQSPEEPAEVPAAPERPAAAQAPAVEPATAEPVAPVPTEEPVAAEPAGAPGQPAAAEPGSPAAEAAAAPEAGEREPRRMGFTDLIGKKGGMTALLHAAREGHAEAVEALLRGGADIEQKSADGTPPLVIATINGHFDLAMRLLELGADPNGASSAGATALYAAINLQWAPTSWYPQPNAQKQQETSYLELMETLLKAGADPNARLERELWYTEFNTPRLSTSHWGATAFWRAAYGLDVDAMKLLMAYGADPNIPSRKKPGRGYGDEGEGDPYPIPPIPAGGPAEYPIHVASGAGYGLGYAGNAHTHKPEGWMPTLRYLVEELGADVNLRDHEGYTPLHNAASRGDTEMVRYLVEHGADLTAVSRAGETAADMANGPHQRIQPFPETLAFLESLGVVNNHRCVSC